MMVASSHGLIQVLTPAVNLGLEPRKNSASRSALYDKEVNALDRAITYYQEAAQSIEGHDRIHQLGNAPAHIWTALELIEALTMNPNLQTFPLTDEPYVSELPAMVLAPLVEPPKPRRSLAEIYFIAAHPNDPRDYHSLPVDERVGINRGVDAVLAAKAQPEGK